MMTDQTAIMLDSFFSTLTGVYQVESSPVPDAVERIGNVIEYTVTVQLSIAP